jgi:serine/threonine protein phosphatase PrpC
VTLVVRHAALTDIGLHRSINEDAFIDEPPLFAVADGMGGAQAGEIASHLALESLARDLAADAALPDAARSANESVYRESRSDLSRVGMGTTLTVALLAGDRLEFAHVGDSRLYLWRDEILEQITDDHSLVGEMVREGHLTREAALLHPQRSILSRALGTDPNVEIDSGAVELRAGDAVLLCSDGLYSMVAELTIAAVLGAVDDPQRVARRLIREAKNEGGHDNITVIVLRLDAPAGAAAPAVGEAATVVLPPSGDEAVTVVLPAPADDGASAEPAEPAVPAAESAGSGIDDAADEPAGSTADALSAPSAEPDAAASDSDAAEPDAAEPDADVPSVAEPGPALPAPRPRRRRRFWFTGAVIALLLVCVSAGAVASDVYFVGDHDGMVSVYRGLPWRVAGVDLNGIYLETTMPLVTVDPGVRTRVDRHDLHRKAAALALARQAQGLP